VHRRIADRTCSNIVAKCLTARPGTLVKVADVVLNFVELEQGAVVMVRSARRRRARPRPSEAGPPPDRASRARPPPQENLVQGFTHKVPKAVVAAVELVHKALW
jgi:hypothetical protein